MFKWLSVKGFAVLPALAGISHKLLTDNILYNAVEPWELTVVPARGGGRKFQEKKDYSEKGAYRKRRLVSSGAARLTQSDVARRKKLKGRERIAELNAAELNGIDSTA